MGLARGTIVQLMSNRRTYNGWVVSDNLEHLETWQGKPDYKGKTIVLKTGKEKKSFAWTDVYQLMVEWDASDKTADNSAYSGKVIKGGSRGRGKDRGLGWWNTKPEDRDVDEERMQANRDLKDLHEAAEQETLLARDWADKLNPYSTYGGAALLFLWVRDPRGAVYSNLKYLTIPWGYIAYLSWDAENKAHELVREQDEIYNKIWGMKNEDIFSDTSF